jgi:hypothetical protein
MAETLQPQILIQVNNRLGVAVTDELMPSTFKPVPQLAIVINLSIEDQTNRVVFNGHRLTTCLQIDDG